MSNVPAVTDTTVDADVRQSGEPGVVDIGAPWCAPCRRTEPIIGELAAEHGDEVRFVELDADRNPRTVPAYEVSSVPTCDVCSGGRLVSSVSGAQARKQLLDHLAR